MHTKLNLEFLREAGVRMTSNVRSLVLAGGVLPDITYFGVIPEKPSHEQGVQFLKHLQRHDPEMAGLGVGFVLHGEKPAGLDWFAHNPKGYVNQKKEPIADVVRRHRASLGGLDLDHTTHCLTEFACDSLVDEEPARALNNAFKQVNTARIAHHLGAFFKSDPKRIKRVLDFITRFDFRQLRTNRGVAGIVQNFVMFNRLGKSYWTNKHKALIERLNLRNYFRIKKTLSQTKEIVKEDYKEFLDSSLEKMQRKLVPLIAGVVLL